MVKSREEAEELLKDHIILHLHGQPWFIEENDDILYSLKIIKDDDYIVRYKYMTEDGEKFVEERMSKEAILKLLTSLVYYQHIRYYGNLNF